MERALSQRLGIDVQEVDTVSSIVASETVAYAIILVIIAAIGILIYITWAFRTVPNSFRYGVAAIVALVHDLLLIVRIFSILGKVLGLEVNAMFIVGLLTVMGYSVNDTIVVSTVFGTMWPATWTGRWREWSMPASWKAWAVP